MNNVLELRDFLFYLAHTGKIERKTIWLKNDLQGNAQNKPKKEMNQYFHTFQ